MGVEGRGVLVIIGGGDEVDAKGRAAAPLDPLPVVLIAPGRGTTTEGIIGKTEVAGIEAEVGMGIKDAGCGLKKLGWCCPFIELSCMGDPGGVAVDPTICGVLTAPTTGDAGTMLGALALAVLLPWRVC